MSAVFVYVPAACPAPTLRVPPTSSVWAPAVKAPVTEGVLAKLVTVMVPDGFPVSVTVPGSVMAYVEVPSPVTLKEAPVTVPVTAGSVTPPVFVRVPSGVRTTVPGFTGLTAILPKFISTVLVMAIGVIIVADVPAVADTCANVLAVSASIATIRIKSFIDFSIVLL